MAEYQARASQENDTQDIEVLVDKIEANLKRLEELLQKREE